MTGAVIEGLPILMPRQDSLYKGSIFMITPLDVVCMQIIQADNRVDKPHYHVADPPLQKPVHIFEEANFHLVDRAIGMSQIGFDYYANVVCYRV